MFDYNSRSPILGFAIAADRGLVEVKERRDFLVFAVVMAKLAYDSVLQADWLHYDVNNAMDVKWAT